MAQPSRALLSEIAAAVPIGAAQSAAIVSTIASRLDRWVAAKQPAQVIVPWTTDIAVHRAGRLWWYRGRAVAPGEAVAALGELLNFLLQADAERVPAGLLYVVARATEPRHLAPFESLSSFAAAVSRHAPEPKAPAIDALLARYLMARSGHAPLGDHSTISDVRRLRRAGGVTLAQIAADTCIPLSLLRELEWGLLVHWDPWHTRRSLEAYAQRAGLEPSSVTAIVRRELEVEHAPVPTALVPLRRPRVVQTGRLSTNQLLPYALAALLLVTVPLVAPADRRAPERVEIQVSSHPASRVTQAQQVTRPAASARPGVDRPAPRAPRRRTAQAARIVALPAATKPAVSERRAAPAPSYRLTRLARAIVGDGRYRAEPFPRVQN